MSNLSVLTEKSIRRSALKSHVTRERAHFTVTTPPSVGGFISRTVKAGPNLL